MCHLLKDCNVVGFVLLDLLLVLMELRMGVLVLADRGAVLALMELHIDVLVLADRGAVLA